MNFAACATGSESREIDRLLIVCEFDAIKVLANGSQIERIIFIDAGIHMRQQELIDLSQSRQVDGLRQKTVPRFLCPVLHVVAK